jgi:signal transduction histidine kinase
MDGSLGDWEQRMLISSLAEASGTHVVVCDEEARVLSCSDGDAFCEHLGVQLPLQRLARLAGVEGSSVLTDLDGFYPAKRYLTVCPVKDPQSGESLGFVLAAADLGSIQGLWSGFLGIFALIAAAILLAVLALSWYMAARQTAPLRALAQAARTFGGGDLSVRLRFEERQDEFSEVGEAFNQMAESLESAEQQRREFIANISHELKTPMTTIAGYTDGILDGTIPPEQEKQYLHIISDESRRLSRLVRRMLEVSQIQSREVMRKAPFDVCESMRRVLISLEKKITDRGLDVEADIPDGSVTVLGDNDLITQVIYNLLENATKFARPGSTLYLGLATSNGKALISVRNDGDTIPAEEIPLLFERFHKSDKSRSEEKDGVGLGLYIVRMILEQHKEHIAVSSEDGVTTFTFTLSLAGGQTQ